MSELLFAPKSLSGRRHLVTAAYTVLAGLHVLIAYAARNPTLIALNATLTFDSAVLALGGILFNWRGFLEILGRVRFFTCALAWPYFMSFAVTVSSTCGFISEETREGTEFVFSTIFYVICLVFFGREFAYVGYTLWDPVGTTNKMLANLKAGGEIDKATGCYKVGKNRNSDIAGDKTGSSDKIGSNDAGSVELTAPGLSAPGTQSMSSSNPSAAIAQSMQPQSVKDAQFLSKDGLPSTQVEFGDCLPRNAVFGGYFRPENSEADNGRLVFVPVPTREGLFIASGLVTLEHLLFGISAYLIKSPHVFPPLFFGGLAVLAGRVYQKQIESLTAARLFIRCVEVFWLFCCLMQERCLCMREFRQVFTKA